MRSKDKQLRVSSTLHRRLKTIAFNKEVYLQDLVDAILRQAVENKDLIERLVGELRGRIWSTSSSNSECQRVAT